MWVFLNIWYVLIKYIFSKFFGPLWLCEFWKVSDLFLCTVSLYSICAIAFDRVWNLVSLFFNYRKEYANFADYFFLFELKPYLI